MIAMRRPVSDAAVGRSPGDPPLSALSAYRNTLPAPRGDIKDELHDGIYGEFAPWTGPTMTYPMPEEADRWLREQWKGWADAGIRIVYRPNIHYVSGHGAPYFSVDQIAEFFAFTIENGSEGMHFGGRSIGDWANGRGPLNVVQRRPSCAHSVCSFQWWLASRFTPRRSRGPRRSTP